MSSRLTPSQTIGPFFHFALQRPGAERLVNESRGDAIRIEGQVFDGDGEPVSDALLEIWQCDGSGHYPHPENAGNAAGEGGFQGFGRAATDEQGRFHFITVKPGRVRGRGNTLQAPHVNLIVFARGLLTHLHTRLYFDDEHAANQEDPLLGGIEDARARDSLLARSAPAGDGMPAYRFDVYLQGDNETAFLEP